MPRSRSGRQSKQKIIWAIDPFEPKNETRPHVIAALRELASRGAMIEPVYVFCPEDYDMSLEFNARWLKQTMPTTTKVLGHYLKDVKIPRLAEPKVIVEKRPSLSRAVGALTAYAKIARADTIVIGTHAKKGLSRFFLGSFAETVVLHSRTPVLVVGPHTDTRGKNRRIGRILFSTDFGPTALPVFNKVVALAKAHHAKISLFHCLRHRVEPVLQSGAYILGGGVVSFPDFETRNEERRRRDAARFAEFARKQGVAIEIDFILSRGSTAETIVGQAELEKADVIAMAAESGPMSAALVGSITRQVVRSAPCPVWVLRST